MLSPLCQKQIQWTLALQFLGTLNEDTLSYERQTRQYKYLPRTYKVLSPLDVVYMSQFGCYMLRAVIIASLRTVGPRLLRCS